MFRCSTSYMFPPCVYRNVSNSTLFKSHRGYSLPPFLKFILKWHVTWWGILKKIGNKDQWHGWESCYFAHTKLFDWYAMLSRAQYTRIVNNFWVAPLTVPQLLKDTRYLLSGTPLKNLTGRDPKYQMIFTAWVSTLAKVEIRLRFLYHNFSYRRTIVLGSG